MTIVFVPSISQLTSTGFFFSVFQFGFSLTKQIIITQNEKEIRQKDIEKPEWHIVTILGREGFSSSNFFDETVLTISRQDYSKNLKIILVVIGYL